jgi:RimJ/RimL family protein N-acetyltransferase
MSRYKNVLETERLILRPITPEDFEAVHSWAGNPENTRYMAWGPNDEEQTKAFLAQAKPGRDFAVVLKDANAVIGSCGIYPKGDGYMGDVGWILHKDYWKRGYGTELCGELICYGFEDLKLGRIQAPCAATNYGSYRIMERNGMRREALHRKAFWARVDEKWIDEAWYAILAEDYFAGNVESENPIRLGIYRHYKGNEYKVIGVAKHSETLEDMVVYKALYGERGTWVRPLSMWDNPIEVDGKTVKRFEYIGDSSAALADGGNVR